MAGYDQKSNVVLSDSKERVYSMEEGVEEIPLGLYLVKGDQMCVTFCFICSQLMLLAVECSLGSSTKHSTNRPICLPFVPSPFLQFATEWAGAKRRSLIGGDSELA